MNIFFTLYSYNIIIKRVPHSNIRNSEYSCVTLRELQHYILHAPLLCIIQKKSREDAFR